MILAVDGGSVTLIEYIFKQQLQVKSFDVATGSETNDYFLTLNFPGHHGSPTQVFEFHEI